MMLVRLEITNFALIDHMVFEPGPGFTILTGETGAGKSLIIDAISALQGNRISRILVRTGTRKAMVEGIFRGVESLFSQEELDESGIAFEDDGFLFLSREIYPDGKSICRINGKNVPVSVLKSFGGRLVDIHGQHDQQTIFSTAMHLSLLDKMCQSELEPVLQDYSERLAEYRELIEKLRVLGMEPEFRARKQELLTYQIREIESADWREEEEEDLRETKVRLLSLEKINASLSLNTDLLAGDGAGSVLTALSVCMNELRSTAHLDSKIQSLFEQVENAYYILEAAKDEMDRVSETYHNPGISLENVEMRLLLFSRLKQKYGNTRGEVLLFLEKAREESLFLESSEKQLILLGQKRVKTERELLDLADEMHRVRECCARRLSTEISSELEALDMKNTSFSVSFSRRPKDRFFSRTGYDEVEFLFSANPGEPEQSLSRIVSGGEASRIMLAIKTILSQVDETPILIFDEIDAGISGKAAMVVSEKLRVISGRHQVLCVTHMAQIAAAADSHFFIDKVMSDDRIHTILQQLTYQERIREVSRLLSGDTQSETSRELAEQLIQKSDSAGEE